MKARPIDRLIGQRVSGAPVQHSNLTLHFRDGSYLNVSNPWILSGGDVSRLAGRTLIGVDECGERITFDFGDRVMLAVDLSEEVWTGPEAMVLVLPDGEIVVWN